MERESGKRRDSCRYLYVNDFCSVYHRYGRLPSLPFFNRLLVFFIFLLLRSCSHKLSLLKEHRGKGKAKSTNREKKQEKAALSRNKYKQAIMRAEDAELIGEKAEYAEHLDVKYTKLKKKKIK